MSDRDIVKRVLSELQEWWNTLQEEAAERREREGRTLKFLAERQAKLEGRLARLESLEIAEQLRGLRAEVDEITAGLWASLELDALAEGEESGIL